jgi:hypothetical protein
MSVPDFPNPLGVNSTIAMSGTLDLDLDNIRVKELAPIAMTSVSTLTSTSTADIGLDDIRIKELPRIDLHVETAMKPTRVHLPVNLRFGFSTLGVELMAFCVCGESMMVVEDYVPHRTELCR